MKNLIKRLFALSLLMLMTQHLFAQSTKGPDALIGVYQSPDGNRKVEVYKENNQYFGKLIAIKGDQGTAKIGTIVFKDFVYSANKWEGKTYLPARDQEFNTTLSLKGNDRLMVKVKAGLMSQTREWSRVK